MRLSKERICVRKGVGVSDWVLSPRGPECFKEGEWLPTGKTGNVSLIPPSLPAHCLLNSGLSYASPGCSESLLIQCFSNFNVHMTYLGVGIISIKYRF